jgi:hypothetical protein
LLQKHAMRMIGLTPLRLLFVVVFVSGTVSFAPRSVVADIESPFCSLPTDPAAPWLPVTPLPNETAVPAPRPASDCQFYRPAWQRFLVATQPVEGLPAFLGYPTFDQIFSGSPAATQPPAPKETVLLSLIPRNMERPKDPTPKQDDILSEINQAGVAGTDGGNPNSNSIRDNAPEAADWIDANCPNGPAPQALSEHHPKG